MHVRMQIDTILEACSSIETAVLVSDFYALKDDLGPTTLAAAKLAFIDAHVTPFMAFLTATIDKNAAAAASASTVASSTAAPSSSTTVPCTSAPLGLTHLVGTGMTIADIAVYSTSCFLGRHLGGDCVAAHPKVARFVAQYEAM